MECKLKEKKEKYEVIKIINMKLWFDTKSETFKKYDILFNKIPRYGECKRLDGSIDNDMEGLRIVSKIYYNYYNNGYDMFCGLRTQYMKNEIKTPIDDYIKVGFVIEDRLETSIRRLINWCWERNATRDDKYQLLTWKRNRV
jgi:hypothetical protein